MTLSQQLVVVAMTVLLSPGVRPGSDPRGLASDPGLTPQATTTLAPEWQSAVRNLRHPDAKTRLAAVEQLGNAGYTPAAEYVAPLVTDPDNAVQFAAIDAELTFFLAESIGARGILSFAGSHSRAQEAFDAGPLVRTAVAAPLVVIENLTAAMRDENPRIRFDAIHALGVLAEAPLPPAQSKALLGGLDHFDPVMRAATARVLGRLRVIDAGEPLIGALNDSNDVVRRCATEALGLIHEQRAVQSLTERFTYHKKGDAAAVTLSALAMIPNASSRDLFRSRLMDGNDSIRRAAAEGLGRLRDRESLPALRTMMASDRFPNVRLAAAFAVGLMDESQVNVPAQALGSADVGAQARDYLFELGPAALPGIQAALATAKESVNRTDLIRMLGFAGGHEMIPVLEPFTRDRDERVSHAAANAIARLTR
jgi:HEAT repeat protein